MPLYLERRGRLWYIRGTTGPAHRRQTVYESTGTDSREIAEEARVEREREIYRAAHHGEQAVKLFADAADSYLEAHADLGAEDVGHIHRLAQHFAATRLIDIGQAAADRACAALVSAEASPARKLRAVIAPLSAVLRHAARRGWCALPSLERPPPSRARTDWLAPADAVKLLDAAADHLRPLLTFLLCTGARVGEAITLDWSDVDLAEGTVNFRDTKSGYDRKGVHLPPKAIVALANLPHREGAVFRRRPTKAMVKRGELGAVYESVSGQFKTGWAGAWRRAGLPGWMSPHALRHTWASYFYVSTRDPMWLMREGGWRSLALVERYAHAMPSHLAPAIADVWGVANPAEFPAAVRARARAAGVQISEASA